MPLQLNTIEKKLLDQDTVCIIYLFVWREHKCNRKKYLLFSIAQIVI